MNGTWCRQFICEKFKKRVRFRVFVEKYTFKVQVSVVIKEKPSKKIKIEFWDREIFLENFINKTYIKLY
jgi:hypothetical protein